MKEIKYYPTSNGRCCNLPEEFDPKVHQIVMIAPAKEKVIEIEPREETNKFMEESTEDTGNKDTEPIEAMVEKASINKPYAWEMYKKYCSLTNVTAIPWENFISWFSKCDTPLVKYHARLWAQEITSQGELKAAEGLPKIGDPYPFYVQDALAFRLDVRAKL